MISPYEQPSTETREICGRVLANHLANINDELMRVGYREMSGEMLAIAEEARPAQIRALRLLDGEHA